MKYDEPFRSEDMEDSRNRFNLWEGYLLSTDYGHLSSSCTMFVEEIPDRTYLPIITKLLSSLASFRIRETGNSACDMLRQRWKFFCQCMKASTFELYNANPIYFFTKYIQGSAKRRGLGCVNSLPGSAWL